MNVLYLLENTNATYLYATYDSKSTLGHCFMFFLLI